MSKSNVISFEEGLNKVTLSEMIVIQCQGVKEGKVVVLYLDSELVRRFVIKLKLFFFSKCPSLNSPICTLEVFKDTLKAHKS